MCSVLGENYLADDAHIPRQAIHEYKWNFFGGVVYKIDGDFDPENIDPNKFPEWVLGAWKLDDNGTIVKPFTPKNELPAPKDIKSSW